MIPAIEGRRLIGCTFASVKFQGRAPVDGMLVRVFVGGALHRAEAALDDAAMERMVCEELCSLLGVSRPPRAVTIHRHPRAMPQYHVGHVDRVAAIDSLRRQHPGLYLTGNAYGGTGLPDCIRHAEETAAELLSWLSRQG